MGDDEEIDEYKRIKLERGEFGNRVYSRLRENQSYFGKSEIEKKYSTLNSSSYQEKSKVSQMLNSFDPDQSKKGNSKLKLNTIVTVA